MRMFIEILLCFSSAMSFAFLIAGWASLLALEQSEIDRLQSQIGVLHGRSFLACVGNYLRVLWRVDCEILRRLKTHWLERPDARFLVDSGGALLVMTLLGLWWLVATA